LTGRLVQTTTSTVSIEFAVDSWYLHEPFRMQISVNCELWRPTVLIHHKLGGNLVNRRECMGDLRALASLQTLSTANVQPSQRYGANTFCRWHILAPGPDQTVSINVGYNKYIPPRTSVP
jgi:hypothetical protein